MASVFLNQERESTNSLKQNFFNCSAIYTKTVLIISGPWPKSFLLGEDQTTHDNFVKYR